MAEIIKVLNKCNDSSNNSVIVRDVFSTIAVYIYFNPSVINYDYDFLIYVYDYITNNTLEIVKFMGYNLDTMDIHNEHFVDNFNRANSLLIYLYNQKNNNDLEKERNILIKSKQNNN